MNKDSFRNWKDSNETKEVFDYISIRREGLKEYLGNGGAADQYEYGVLVGKIRVLQEILDLTNEDLENDA